MEDHKNLVSVVIPTYNRANTIERAVKSVLNQSYKNWELIIVDDGSTDNTIEVLAPYLVHKSIFLIQQENNGVCAARNEGIRYSKGKYITFLDSDDEFLQNKIKVQLKEILKYTCDLSLCNFYEYRNKRKIKKRFNFKESFYVSEDDIASYKIPMSASYTFLKRNLARLILFDENMPSSNDFDFVLRSSKMGKVLFTNTRLVNTYKALQGNRISTNLAKKIAGYKVLLSKTKKNTYKLNEKNQEILLKRTYYNLCLFYTLSNQSKKAKECSKKLHKSSRGKLISFRIFILNLIIKNMIFKKIIVFINKILWKFGLIQN